MRTAIFPARFDQLDDIREFVNQASQDARMEEVDRCAVEMAVDEACSNIIEHAYKDTTPGEIEITCDYDERRMVIFLRDHGKPFDPNAVNEPDLSRPLKQRKVGGLGVYLIRKMMDEVRYEALGESGNVLFMVKYMGGSK